MGNKETLWFFYGFVLSLILIALLFSILIPGVETKQIEAPCVDGDGDVNLAGIMCEKQLISFYGNSDDFNESLVILLFLILTLTISISILALFLTIISFFNDGGINGK